MYSYFSQHICIRTYVVIYDGTNTMNAAEPVESKAVSIYSYVFICSQHVFIHVFIHTYVMIYDGTSTMNADETVESKAV